MVKPFLALLASLRSQSRGAENRKDHYWSGLSDENALELVLDHRNKLMEPGEPGGVEMDEDEDEYLCD